MEMSFSYKELPKSMQMSMCAILTTYVLLPLWDEGFKMQIEFLSPNTSVLQVR